MKTERFILKAIVKSIRDAEQALQRLLDENLHRMEKAETVEEVMAIKKDILIDWITTLPILGVNCYFCYGFSELNVQEPCKICPYGKIHGKCSDPNSDYRFIRERQSELIGAICRYYPFYEGYGNCKLSELARGEQNENVLDNSCKERRKSARRADQDDE